MDRITRSRTFAVLEMLQPTDLPSERTEVDLALRRAALLDRSFLIRSFHTRSTPLLASRN